MTSCVLFEKIPYMQYCACFTATFTLASIATYATWGSPSLPKLTSDDSPIGRKLTIEEASWVISIISLGSLIGSFIAGFIVTRLGPKKTLHIASIPFFVPWILIIFAKSSTLLMVARAIGGIGQGITIVVAPIYFGEIAEKEHRGKLTVLGDFTVKFSNFYVLGVGPFITYNALALSCSILPLLFATIFYFMPESPYYLVKMGKEDVAKYNLKRLSCKNTDEQVIMYRLNEIEKTIGQDMKDTTSLWEFLSNRKYRLTLIITIVEETNANGMNVVYFWVFLLLAIPTLRQLSGTVVMDAYKQTIIKSSNSSISPEISSVIFGITEVAAAFICIALIDRMGRRFLLITSTIGCAVALIAEGTYFYLQDAVHANVNNLSWVPTVSLSLYILMNHIGLFPIPLVLMGELFSTNIKGMAISFTFIYGGLLGFVVMKFFEPLSNAWGRYVVFWIFAGVCLLGAVFIYVLLPETKGKTFKEIQEKLYKNNKNYKYSEAA